jgi:adenine C2-methylase RlmN of 23S rRNA A2503 and tRNA A37
MVYQRNNMEEENNNAAVEVEKQLVKDFGDRIKKELAEIGLIKQEERLKVSKNTKGFNYEYSLLGKVEDNIERAEKLNAELDKRLGA